MSDRDLDWNRVDAYLLELLDLEGVARDRRLSELSAQDPELAMQLVRMLANAEACGSLLDLGVSTFSAEAVAHSGVGELPDALGPWEIVRRIGEGGMAQVLEGRREIAGSTQAAAIKLLSGVYRSDGAIRRFEQETAILARLQDPRIARLIDAGVTAAGRRWLAMEYISGRHIDDACRQSGCSLRERVRLMIEIAGAVAHAHQHLIVHCDLKPSNILLDDDNRVRLLDFGIATVIGSETEEGADVRPERAYTFLYASPEQLRGESLTTASDVHQLGVVFHRLLFGVDPFGGPEQTTAQRIESMRRGAQRPQAADVAYTVPLDLFAVIRKATAFELDARYPNAMALADDLGRWLEGRAVSAYSTATAYRARKFLQRHWIPSSATALALILLVGSLILALANERRLQAERDAARAAQARSEAMQAYLLDVFGSVDPQLRSSRGKTTDQLLLEAADKAQREFADQPEIAAKILTDLGQVLMRRGMLEEARRTFEQVLAIATGWLGDDHPDALAVLPELAESYYHLRQFDQARAYIDRYLRSARTAYGEDSMPFIRGRLASVRIISATDGEDAAIAEAQAVIDLYERAFGRIPRDNRSQELQLLETDLLHQLAVMHLRKRDYQSAAPLMEQAVKSYRTIFGEQDSRTHEAILNWAYLLRLMKQPERAQGILEQLLAAQRSLYGRAHWRTAYVLGHLANLASDAGQYARSIELWEESEAEIRAASGDEHPWIHSAQGAIARAMLLDGQCEEGESRLRRIMADPEVEQVVIDRAQAVLDKYACAAEQSEMTTKTR